MGFDRRAIHTIHTTNKKFGYFFPPNERLLQNDRTNRIKEETHFSLAWASEGTVDPLPLAYMIVFVIFRNCLLLLFSN